MKQLLLKIDQFFEITKRKSTIKKECISGLTTFLSVSYALMVVPSILSDGGVPIHAAYTGCVIVTAIGTLIASLYANYPVVMISSIGTNALLAYGITSIAGYRWEMGMAAVVIAGALFVLLTVCGIREKVINSIPSELQYAIISGIGLFIAFLGLQNAGIIVSGTNLVTIGNIMTKEFLVVFVGVVVITILAVRKNPYSIIIGLITTIVFGILVGVVAVPENLISMPHSMGEIAFASIPYIKDFFDPSILVLVFSILFTNFFDSLGTLLAVGNKTGLIQDGKYSGSRKAMFADASSSFLGGILGAGSTTTALESLTGISLGGRTGLSSLVSGILFLSLLFLSPIISMINDFVTAPILIILGAMMCSNLVKIDFSKIEIAIPCFLIIILMPLMFSITKGIAIGFIFYTICNLAVGRYKDITLIMWILNIMFILYMIVG